ncbi:MAG: SDR family oxidoreductase [Rubrivivax sp.]|nr:SDR family oxidoreductase [Rubrivivax sp.]
MKTDARILVVGATGVLGRPAVKLLRERGVVVRALSRHPERAADLAALGAEVVAGDLTDTASLQRACQGATRVLACAHGLLGRGRWRSEAVDDAGHRALIAAARDAGVERFVYTSALGTGADHPIDFFRTKAAIEAAVRASGMPFAILRPSAFMEHHVHNFNGKGLLEKGKVQLIGPGTKPRNFIAGSDVAAFAVRALLDEPLPFATLDIGGHEHLSGLDVARLYAQAAGVEARVAHLPAAVARALAVLARPVHPGMARVMRLLSLPDDAFDESFDGAAALEARFGLRLKRVPEFVREQVVLAGPPPAH